MRSQCLTKERVCIYTKSNRGGPRVSTKKRQKHRSQSEHSGSHSGSSKNGIEEIFAPIKVNYEGFDYNELLIPMIAPGAGLRPLSSYQMSQHTGSRILNTDHIFDSIFGQDVTPEDTPHVPLLRSYNSDKDM